MPHEKDACDVSNWIIVRIMQLRWVIFPILQSGRGGAYNSISSVRFYRRLKTRSTSVFEYVRVHEQYARTSFYAYMSYSIEGHSYYLTVKRVVLSTRCPLSHRRLTSRNPSANTAVVTSQPTSCARNRRKTRISQSQWRFQRNFYCVLQNSSDTYSNTRFERTKCVGTMLKISTWELRRTKKKKGKKIICFH